MKMRLLLAAGLLLAGSVLAAAQEAAAPKIGDNEVVFGAKKLTLNPNGVIVCTDQAGRKIFELVRGLWGKSRATNQYDWAWSRRFFDAKQTVFRREGNKFIWEVKYTVPGEPTFTAVVQSLEVLPDGRLRYSNRLTLPELKEWSLEPDGIMLTLPQDVWNGAAVKLHDTESKLDIEAKMKLTIPWQVKKQKAVLAPGDPAKQITLEGERGKNYDGFSLVPYKVLKNFRLTVNVQRPLLRTEACIFTLDLR